MSDGQSVALAPVPTSLLKPTRVRLCSTRNLNASSHLNIRAADIQRCMTTGPPGARSSSHPRLTGEPRFAATCATPKATSSKLARPPATSTRPPTPGSHTRPRFADPPISAAMRGACQVAGSCRTRHRGGWFSLSGLLRCRAQLGDRQAGIRRRRRPSRKGLRSRLYRSRSPT